MENLDGMTGRNVLVTGGTGLVGSHLVARLLSRGARVVVPVRSRDPRSCFVTEGLEQNVTTVHADIRDYSRMREVIAKYEIEYVFHLAAQAIVATAYNNPLDTIESNVMGTANILEACRLYPGIKGIVVASSDKAYGKSGTQYVESDALKGDHPYEVSKSACDLIAQSYAKTYGLNVTVARFGNIYGPGDLNFNRIIPGIMLSAVNGQRLVLRSNGTMVRDYVYVGDVVSGYEFLMDRIGQTAGNAYNLSSGVSMTVLEAIGQIGKILGADIRYEIVDTAINEIPYQHLDTAKISSLGWKPVFGFEQGIRETYTWYKRYFMRTDGR